jgi:hypothetical protein
MFGALGRMTGSPQLAFLALLALTVRSLVWLHLAELRIRVWKVVDESGNRLPRPQTATSSQ